MTTHRLAFIGTGGIAQAHAYALAALPYYYQHVPELVRVAVASATPERRDRFARRYGFAHALDPEALWSRRDLDTLFLLGPNALHASHLHRALAMDGIRRVYVEKPLCVTQQEEEALARLVVPPEIVIHTGFQFLHMAAIRHAWRLWRAGDLGAPIHFHARYLHSGYLERRYRDARHSRLAPAPEGGALADLGCHSLSLLVAFLGEELEVVAARQSGSFDDVPPASDLCTTVLLQDRVSGAVGTVVASRISAGAGEEFAWELRGERGALRFSTERPDVLEVCCADQPEAWRMLTCGSDYTPHTTFPAQFVSAGWLRALIHAHAVFFGEQDEADVLPDLAHALTVQRLVRQTVELLAAAHRTTR